MKAYKFLVGGIGILMLLGFLAVATPVAFADLKATEVVYSWDYAVSRYQNSMVVVPWDGGWSSFVHNIGFDTDVFISGTVGQPGYVNTPWAGYLDYAVAHMDNNPFGAPGFRTTRNWSLVFCDRDGDGSFPSGDLDISPPNGYMAPSQFIEFLPTVFTNQLQTCAQNVCEDELVTRLFINLDKNNDGVIDAAYRVGGVIGGAVRPICFYAEAQRPIETTVTWKGNPQARIAVGGGDKTVNFSPTPGGTTAVTLSSFNASMPDNTEIPMGLAITGVLGLISAVAGLGLWKFTQRTR